jgi:hypothetical protein
MSDKEHGSQRSLVELSLRRCPEGGRHKAKGHGAKQGDPGAR